MISWPSIGLPNRVLTVFDAMPFAICYAILKEDVATLHVFRLLLLYLVNSMLCKSISNAYSVPKSSTLLAV